MKKIKTSELTGAALDWAVAKCEGQTVRIDASIPSHLILVLPGEESMVDDFYTGYSPSTNWAQGGPLIEREGVNLRMHTGTDKQPIAFVWVNHTPAHREQGPTPLIAAMRCYVASKLGDEIEVPEELQ